MKNLTGKIGGAILTLALIFGICAAAGMTAQAQDRRDRDAVREILGGVRRADRVVHDVDVARMGEGQALPRLAQHASGPRRGFLDHRFAEWSARLPSGRSRDVRAGVI